MTALWLVLPLFIFTQLSWKWGKLRFVRLKQTHEPTSWNQVKQIFPLMKIQLFLGSCHKWWCQQWLSTHRDLIWKWAPTDYHALCKMFRLGDAFLHAVVLIRLCKNRFYPFNSAKQPRSLRRKKDILSQIGLNVQKPLQLSYFWSIYSWIPVICMKQKQRSTKCVGKYFIISLHQFREWV